MILVDMMFVSMLLKMMRGKKLLKVAQTVDLNKLCLKYKYASPFIPRDERRSYSDAQKVGVSNTLVTLTLFVCLTCDRRSLIGQLRSYFADCK